MENKPIKYKKIMDYEKMTTEKLQALLPVASDEDKKEIESVLSSRGATPTTVYEDPDMTDEERTVIDEAGKNEGTNPSYKRAAKSELSDEERAALVASAREVVRHRCEVVPFNSQEWLPGVIVGVVNDKRSKVLLAIRLDSGRRVVKVFGSPLIKILDEVAEVPARTPRPCASHEPWTDDEINEDMAKLIGNVGRVATLSSGETGRIKTIVLVRRARRLLYEIEVPAPTEEMPNKTKALHRVPDASDLVIADELDATGADINAKFIARRERMAKLGDGSASAEIKYVATEKSIIALEAKKKTLEEKMAKLADALEAKKKTLEALCIQLNGQVSAGQASEELA